MVQFLWAYMNFAQLIQQPCLFDVLYPFWLWDYNKGGFSCFCNSVLKQLPKANFVGNSSLVITVAEGESMIVRENSQVYPTWQWLSVKWKILPVSSCFLCVCDCVQKVPETVIKDQSNIVMIYSHWSKEFLQNNIFSIIRALDIENGNEYTLITTF